jgi:hypothetical protein
VGNSDDVDNGHILRMLISGLTVVLSETVCSLQN